MRDKASLTVRRHRHRAFGPEDHLRAFTHGISGALRPKCPPPRQYHADIQARLLVLACQKPSEVDPSRAGQTHWSINDLAQYLAVHPELGLGHPSKSTIGVILKRHQVRLDRL